MEKADRALIQEYDDQFNEADEKLFPQYKLLYENENNSKLIIFHHISKELKSKEKQNKDAKKLRKKVRKQINNLKYSLEMENWNDFMSQYFSKDNIFYKKNTELIQRNKIKKVKKR